VRQLATLLYSLLIVWLFYLDRDRRAKISRAVWLPVIWLFVNSSRDLSQWLAILGFGHVAAASPEQFLEGSPIDRNLYTVLTLLGIIVLINRQRLVERLLRATRPVQWYLCYCLISCVWSDFPDVAFKRWIKVVGDLVMMLVILTEADPLAATKRVFARVGFIVLPVSILWIKYYPWLARTYENVLGIPIITGIATSKNILGMITLLFGLSSLWRVVNELSSPKGARQWRPLLAHSIVLAMTWWLFVTANSATSESCFIMVGTAMLITRLTKFGRKPAVIHLFAFGTVGLSLFSIFIAPTLLGTLGRDSTLTGRTDIWKLVLSMAGNPLVGTGFESFWLGPRLHRVWNVYRFHLNEAHNGYIEVYINLGWIGITLFGVLVVTGYRNVIAAFRRDPAMGSLKLAFLVVTVVYNLTEAAIRSLNPVWTLFLFAITASPAGGGQRAPQVMIPTRAGFVDQPEANWALRR